MDKRGILTALAAGASIVAFAAPAQAQQVHFSIPPGDLKSALDAYGRQTGRPILYKADELRETRSSGFSGVATAAQALTAILANTGFAAHDGASGAVAIVRSRRAASAQITGKPDETSPPPEENADGQSDVTELVVTGTRVRSSFTAPSPTLAIGSDDLQRRGATNLATLLDELPAVNARNNPAANGTRTQTPASNFVDLRNLGPSRTLVLVDGHRFVPSVPSSAGGNGTVYQVDINLIPSLMIDRVELVTGGASAQYGSDAVAGVANLILRKRVKGIEAEVQGGISQHGDDAEYRIGLVGGFSFAGDRGHVVFSGDYVKTNGLRDYFTRSWASNAYNIVVNPAATVANGLPGRVLVSNTQPGNRTPGGLIVNATGGSAADRAALIGLDFLSASQVAPFVRGNYNPATTSTTFAATQQGGTHPDATKNSLVPQLERKVFYGRGEFEVSPALTVYAELSYGRSTGTVITPVSADQSGVYNPATAAGSQVRIYADNPFIPAAIRPSIPAPAGLSTATLPAQSFVLARVNDDLPFPTSVVTEDAVTGVIGAEGQLGRGWTWDAAFSYGRNDYIRNSYNIRNRASWAQAADAVLNSSGQIVCRSTLTNPSDGCVPLNLFGSGSPSAAAIAYVTDEPYARLRYVQETAQVNVQGSPFATWAGPVAVAFGLEWRHETANSVVDALTLTNVFDSSVGSPFQGGFTVKEGYVETTVPLADDLPFAYKLAVNGAVRHAIYSGFGGVTTWKVGATYEPVRGVMFRATRSLDIRAPSLYELLIPPTASITNITYVIPNTTTTTTANGIRVLQSGNADLRPERSKTFTAGVTFTPAAVPRLQLSADYFNIRVNDVIASLGGQAIATNCGNGLTQFCPLLTFDANNVLQGVSDRYLNLASYATSGVDLSISYRTPLGGMNLSLQANATHYDHFTITTPGTPPAVLQFAGQNSNFQFASPHWRANASATLSSDLGSVTLQSMYVGPGRQDLTLSEVATATKPADISAADNYVGSYFLFNLSGTVNIGHEKRAQLFWVINNLFDRDPIITPASRTQANGSLYDVVGRYFRLGLRTKF